MRSTYFSRSSSTSSLVYFRGLSAGLVLQTNKGSETDRPFLPPVYLLGDCWRLRLNIPNHGLVQLQVLPQLLLRFHKCNFTRSKPGLRYISTSRPKSAHSTLVDRSSKNRHFYSPWWLSRGLRLSAAGRGRSKTGRPRPCVGRGMAESTQ